ncbi:MAG: NAD(P)/FAD-dependent oxidoreductase [Patescibacteria group bacterium]
MKDVIIIGGGPAGIVAGIYASRKNLDGLLLTKDFIGQVGNAGKIENWPGEKDIIGPMLIDKFRDHLEDYDTQIKEEKVSEVTKEGDVFLVKSENETYKSKAVIVATGRNPRPLKVPGEKEFVGKGVSYCVTCDGALFKGKEVAVVGGGNSGLEGALELSEYVEKVTVLEIAPELQGDEFLRNRVDDRENIDVLTKVKVQKVEGDDFVNGLRYKDLDNDEEKLLEVDGIFVEVGSIPTTDILDNLVEYTESGEIKVNPQTCETDADGLFAAGDVTNVRDKQIVVATGEGCKALLSAYNYIKN